MRIGSRRLTRDDNLIRHAEKRPIRHRYALHSVCRHLNDETTSEQLDYVLMPRHLNVSLVIPTFSCFIPGHQTS